MGAGGACARGARLREDEAVQHEGEHTAETWRRGCGLWLLCAWGAEVFRVRYVVWCQLSGERDEKRRARARLWARMGGACTFRPT